MIRVNKDLQQHCILLLCLFIPERSFNTYCRATLKYSSIRSVSLVQEVYQEIQQNKPLYFISRLYWDFNKKQLHLFKMWLQMTNHKKHNQKDFLSFLSFWILNSVKIRIKWRMTSPCRRLSSRCRPPTHRSHRRQSEKPRALEQEKRTQRY